MTDAEAAGSEILLDRRGQVGHIVLNRPKAINALNHAMVLAIQEALESWRDDDSVETIVFTGAGERGFCAGGDIVSIYHDATAGGGAASEQFWRDEYQLNATIANYPKPTVAIQDGIVLGGGIGISGHSTHRIVTERSKVGMPETGIGFIPDVGGMWLLTQRDVEAGTLVALTGSMVSGADAIEVNLSDVFVPSDEVAALLTALETTDADTAVAAAAKPAPASQFVEDRAWIADAFSAPTALEVVARLRANGSERAIIAADTIEAKSPSSVVVTLEAIRRAADMKTVEEALQQDFRAALASFYAPDFTEGIRAQVIDKDRQPKWTPATLAEVGPSITDAYFASLGDRELRFT